MEVSIARGFLKKVHVGGMLSRSLLIGKRVALPI